MKRKQQFLKAIEILAPRDQFILKAARSVPEQSLPLAPGGAALELVVALQKLKPAINDDVSGRRQLESGCVSSIEHGQLSMGQAMRIQSAQYWLQLGDVDQALLELGALSTKAFNHPLAQKAHLAVCQASAKLNDVTVQE